MSFVTLMYHEIRERRMLRPEQYSPIDVNQNYYDELPPTLFVSLENFEEQMNYLFVNGFHTLSLEELRQYFYHGKAIPQKSVLLTFDDCYQSVKEYAYPILKKYHFHAVGFVVTGWLHTSAKPFQTESSICMTRNDLEEMKDVFEYANHTELFHTRSSRTSSAMMVTDDQAISEDLDRCNASGILDVTDTFAYPFGLWIDRHVSLLRRKGFRLAFTSEGGKNDTSIDPLLLRRNVIPYFMELKQFIKLLTGIEPEE